MYFCLSKGELFVFVHTCGSEEVGRGSFARPFSDVVAAVFAGK